MDYMEASGLMARYGIRIARGIYVSSSEEAMKFSEGRPIALKAISEKALHKTKSGLVMLNLSSPEAIKAGYDELAEKGKKLGEYKMLAQEMNPGGLEIIIGGKIDPQFGKMVLVGLGGIYVETFKDFAMGVCPVNPKEATGMLGRLRSVGIIAPDEKTHRAVSALISKVSRLFYENEITELDLNPVIVHDGSYEAVDIRMIKDQK